MKKIFMSAVLCLLTVLCLAACGNTDKTDPTGGKDTPQLSSDTSIAVAEVCGVAVSDGTVTLSSEQYAELGGATDIKTKCTYTLADKASVDITLDGTELVFEVTAEDGTTARTVVTVDVVVIEPEIYSVCGKPVRDGMVTLVESEYRTLCDSSDIMSLLDCSEGFGPDATAYYDTATHCVVASTGADGKNVITQVDVVVPFGTHTVIGYGSKNNVEWDHADAKYTLGKNGAAAFKTESDGDIVDCYSVSADVALSGFKTNSEVVFFSYEAANLTMRFYMRIVDATHISVRSDYRDKTDYKNEIFLTDDLQYSSGEFFNVKIINVRNSMVMLFEGSTLYRRTLPDMTHSEPVVFAYDCNVWLKNVGVLTDEAAVAAEFEAAMSTYDERPYGKALTGVSENIGKIEVGSDGDIVMNNASSSVRIMAALYDGGVPVAGYEYAVGGKISVTNTKTSGGSASKIELQICKDLSNYVKFHIFRFPTNNTFFAYPTINGVNTTVRFGTQNNMLPMPADGVYEVEYYVVYNNGLIEVWLKDGSAAMPDYTLVYSYDSDWGYTGYCFANKQLCDVVWKETTVYRDELFDKLFADLHGTDGEFTAADAEAFESDNNVIRQTTDSDAETALLYNDQPIAGDCFVLSGTLAASSYKSRAAGKIVAESVSKRVEYNLEYLNSDTAFKVFAHYTTDGKNYTGYDLLYPPKPWNNAHLNFTVVVESGKCTFLMDGLVYHVAENMTGDVKIMIGGTNCKIKVSRLSAETDETKVGEFAANMKRPTYVSPYESRIDALSKQYANAQKGGVLLAGSSTIDFWESYQQDLGEEKLIYNVGIGGTTTDDWVYAYDRLIKPFEPSKVLIFLGGNDISTGQTAQHAVDNLGKILEKIHADFPNAELFYALSLPTASYYTDGKFHPGFAEVVNGMREYGRTHDFVTIIDAEALLTENGRQIDRYVRPDNVHLSEEGYKVWSAYVKSIMFPEE